MNEMFNFNDALSFFSEIRNFSKIKFPQFFDFVDLKLSPREN